MLRVIPHVGPHAGGAATRSASLPGSSGATLTAATGLAAHPRVSVRAARPALSRVAGCPRRSRAAAMVRATAMSAVRRNRMTGGEQIVRLAVAGWPGRVCAGEAAAVVDGEQTTVPIMLQRASGNLSTANMCSPATHDDDDDVQHTHLPDFQYECILMILMNISIRSLTATWIAKWQAAVQCIGGCTAVMQRQMPRILSGRVARQHCLALASSLMECNTSCGPYNRA